MARAKTARAKTAREAPRRRTAAKRGGVETRLRELDVRARREDAHAASLLVRAAKVPCGDDEGRARKNSLLIEAKQSRTQASQSRRLAEQLASGHVPSPTKRAKRTTTTTTKPHAGGKRKAK